jgi:ribosome-associated heat shock protein Hsp15
VGGVTGVGVVAMLRTYAPKHFRSMSSRDGGTLRHIESVRIDLWLHAVRLTKTRSDATDACRAGHVTINGKSAKPASPVKVGDHVEARLAQRQRVVEVTRLLTKRVGAPVAAECFDDHSPPPPEHEPYQGLFGVRDRGTGRPTKRDRRQIDRLRGRSG